MYLITACTWLWSSKTNEQNRSKNRLALTVIAAAAVALMIIFASHSLDTGAAAPGKRTYTAGTTADDSAEGGDNALATILNVMRTGTHAVDRHVS